MNTTIRLNVQHVNMRSLHTIDSWVERQIVALGATRRIDEANIRLARVQESSPAYEVRAHLVTPGPDVFAEARDHTLQAAFTKVIGQLKSKIARRAVQRLQRQRGNLGTPRPT